MSNNAIEVLTKAYERVKLEKTEAMARFDSELRDLETSIERLSGKKVWEVVSETRYDDEHPDYIKASAEEI
jgi:hypothetical protein